MAIADNKALLSEIMNLIEDHVTAKASRQLEKQIMDILDGYQIVTMIRDDSGDADNSKQLIDAFIAAKTAEGLAKSSITLLDRGMRIEEVQVILGHEKIETTRRYCHASQRNTENSYRKFACM